MTKKGKIKLAAFFAVLVLAAAAAGAVSSHTVTKLLYPVKYAELVEKYSEAYGIDKILLYAVIRTESGFDSNAKSSAGALGLTQMTPETFEWLCTKTGEDVNSLSLFDADTSVRYGAFFLKYLLDEFGDTRTALAAYHAGRGRVNGWLKDREISPDGKVLGDIPVPETAHYVQKVTKAVNVYTNIYFS